jgi:hypothetical protein
LASVAAVLAFCAPVASAAFGVSKWEAGTCTSKGCTVSTPEQFYTQAAGHPPFGITDFSFNTDGSGAPEGHVREVRVDIPPGLSVDPFATPQCKLSELESLGCPSDTQVGEVELTVHLLATVTIKALVYNMEPPNGVPLEAAFKVAPGEIVHIVGGIDWAGDYHEFFTIKEIPNGIAELVESRLIFSGTALGPGGAGPFITMPSSCLGPQTSFLKVRSYEGQQETKSFTTPVGVSGCDEVPFKPEVVLMPATAQSDRPDAATVEVKLPQNSSASAINSSTLEDAQVTLPEGMTLNPAAANGLEACTDAQFGKGTTGPVSCPAASQIGTVTVETPNLPPGSLTGNVYAGQPLSGNPESGQEYRIFIDAEAPRYGVSVRLLGSVSANATTGQLTTAVLENPQIPFSDFIVTLGGPHVPLANPLLGTPHAGASCGLASPSAAFAPYSGNPPALELAGSPFAVDFDGKGGACPSPLPYALTQSAQAQPSTGGSTTSFTLNLARGDGNQYLAKTSTTLPPGLVGKVPAVQACGEPQAMQGKCPAASQIGTVGVALGAGPNPLTLPGTVYFTGPYAGAPYGLLVAVPAEKIGPFDYGTIFTRATIGIDPHTARVTVSSVLPTIVGGVPLRLKTIAVTVDRPGFLLDPTNCGLLATETLLTSTFGSTQLVSTPFQATGCGSLPFKPIFTASTDAKASRRNGAMLTVKVGYPTGRQANIRSVFTQLPKQLPARVSTLNKACPEATFNANPAGCPPESRVGSAMVTTPVLPGTMSGAAYFVSHGGAAFPDFDIVLSGANGVTIVLVGNTNIAHGITSSTFPAIPDVPVSSFELNLPMGRFSALGANGSLCAQPLIMPTTITAQNGAVVAQKTRISVSGCRRAPRLRILSHRVRGHRVRLVLHVPAAGRLRVGGADLKTVSRRVGRVGNVRVSVGLSRAGLRALARAHRHRRHLKVRVRVRFAPSSGHASAASVTVRFR